MKGRKDKISLSILGLDSDSAPKATDPATNSDDEELRSLLAEWRAPGPSSSLDQNILSAYRTEVKSGFMKKEVERTDSVPANRAEGAQMKTCPTCQEEFADKFSFCPVDGTPLNELAASIIATPPPIFENGNNTFHSAESVGEDEPLVSPSAPVTPWAISGKSISPADDEPEYHLTIIEDAGLAGRLLDQLKLVAHESELTWPEFKRDPSGFASRMVRGYTRAGYKFMREPNVGVAVMSAFFVLFTVVLGILFADRLHLSLTKPIVAVKEPVEQLELETLIPSDIPPEKPDEGIGTGKEGRVGFNKGKGEGSEPKFKKASGGGGGGQEEQLPPQQGKLPPSSPVPSYIPTVPPTKPPLLPTAGIDLDPALNKDLPFDRYGDPRSKSTATSAGPGTGLGIGKGTGAGIGEGEGGGFGPGRGGNMGGGDRGLGGGGAGGGTGNNGIDYNKNFSAKDVTQKARILSKPEPQYTEDARKNQVVGTVVLRAVLSSSGEVTNIRPVSTLPYGLTDKAIAAARMIKFVPAQKDGHTVSQWIQIEYNFNLY
jgi:TonB family protein